MDKNFIRIDDLVRQHLEGAEEKERGGAWLKMRDLLDQEMPQKKRIGILYWRRLFGVVAAVSLIGTLTVGSYEFSSAYRNNRNADVSAPVSNAASTENGLIAMDIPASEPENDPATSGNISVRANTHAARTLAPGRIANTATANTNNNNTSNNNTNTSANTINTTTNTNTGNATANSSNANNNDVDVNIRGRRITHTAAANGGAVTANNTGNTSANTTNNTTSASNNNRNSNSADYTNGAIATTSNAVPDKPVTSNGKAGAKTGKHIGTTTNKSTTATGVVGKTSNAAPATEKTVATNNNARKNNTGNAAKTATSKTAASATTNAVGKKNNSTNTTNANNTATTVATTTGNENAIAQNGPAASTSSVANNNKQDIGALNSSGPSIATSAPNAEAAKAKDMPNATAHTNETGAGNNATAVKTGAAKTTNTSAAANEPGAKNTATSASASTKNTADAKGNTATAASGVKGNTTGAKSTASASTTATATTKNASTNTPAAKNATAAIGKSATGNGTSNLSGNIRAKRITKGATTAAAGTTAGKQGATNKTSVPAKNAIAANTPGASEEDEDETVEAADTKTAAKTNGTSKKTSTATGTVKVATNKVKADKATASVQKKASGSNEAGKAKATNNGKMADKQSSTAIVANSGGNAPDGDTKQEDKKTITKMVVREREVKNSDDEVMTAVDTLSMEKMDRGTADKEEGEEPAVAKTATQPASANKTASSNTGIAEQTTENNPVSATVSGKRIRGHQTGTTSSSLNEENGAAETESAPALAASAPAAAEETPAANATAAAETKTKAKSKHGGASLLRKMSAMFNDVKDQARGARPIAGITAGINSNFFGPSKMMGFQFGMTGAMEFSETWSLMAELKYFHRVNNNTVTDDYYTYTQVGSQYQKQLVQTSYDFAAAHNVEMPVTIRYAKGNFNFYTGANLLYSFSINTARATLPDMADPVMVSTPGTDNAAKFKDADFGSRFGLGYIFGFSYQVAPNTSLDLRNVQTVWDNASSAGAKSVSSMLYRTPSVQLSIMYRLGGNKNKE